MSYSIEAEQSVLGGILLDNPSYFTITDLLGDHDFYREDQQLIFRATKDRVDDNQTMSDLRESGALEQDASCVLFIYRDEVYDENSAEKGRAELIIAKHRGGQTGMIHCAFVGKHQRFADHLIPTLLLST